MLPCSKIVRDQQQLTPEQEAYAREFARERMAAMLSTASIDKQEAEEYLRAAYHLTGLKHLTTIRWFDSPLSFAQVDIPSSAKFAPDRLGGNYPEQMWWEKNLPIIMSLDIGSHAVQTMRIPAWSSTVAIWRTIMYRWYGEGGHEVKHSVVSYSHARQFAPLLFLQEVSDEVRDRREMIYLARFNEMVSGYWLGYREAWVVYKPTLLEWDAQGQLHSSSGPCILYRDGWGVYAWHGVPVSEKLIMHPEQVTRKEWLQEPNAEVRRAIQERLGFERFIEMVGGKQIDAGRRGNLIEIDLGNDPEQVAHYVQVQDSSTQRHYYLRVPPSITKADEAIAWTFGFTKAEYQPRQET